MNLKDIQTLAELLVREYNPEELSPFPFDNILKSKPDLKILRNAELESDISGIIAYQPQEQHYVILINDQKPQVRQYFTLAHELGHYFLHQKQIQESPFVDSDSIAESLHLYRRDDNDSTRLEIEANHFAGCLLMPEDLVKKVWDVLPTIEDCARIFKVSSVAMSVRLNKLGLIS